MGNSKLTVNQIAAIGMQPRVRCSDVTVAVMSHLLISAVTRNLFGQPDKNHLEWSSAKLRPN